MKAKLSEWGNSHGIRITSAMIEHLNVRAGDELEVQFTNKGIEIVKTTRSVDYVKAVSQEILKHLLETTAPVQIVADPYAESDVAYLVIALNPCNPLVRIVPKGTPDAHATLADAKEAARQILQTAIEEARLSLVNLRQLGVDNINYIAL